MRILRIRKGKRGGTLLCHCHSPSRGGLHQLQAANLLVSSYFWAWTASLSHPLPLNLESSTDESDLGAACTLYEVPHPSFPSLFLPLSQLSLMAGRPILLPADRMPMPGDNSEICSHLTHLSILESERTVAGAKVLCIGPL